MDLGMFECFVRLSRVVMRPRPADLQAYRDEHSDHAAAILLDLLQDAYPIRTEYHSDEHQFLKNNRRMSLF